MKRVNEQVLLFGYDDLADECRSSLLDEELRAFTV